MTYRFNSLLVVLAAASLVACGANPQPVAPEPQPVEGVDVQAAAPEEQLTDRFEFAYQVRRVSTWLFFAVLVVGVAAPFT